MGKIKFTPEKKIEIIEAYKSGKVAYSQLQDVYGMNRDEIYRWISKYPVCTGQYLYLPVLAVFHHAVFPAGGICTA